MKAYEKKIIPVFKTNSSKRSSLDHFKGDPASHMLRKMASTKANSPNRKTTLQKPVINLISATFGEDLPVVSPGPNSAQDNTHTNCSNLQAKAFSFASLTPSAQKEGAYLINKVSTLRSVVLQEMAENYTTSSISRVPTTMPKKAKPVSDKRLV